MRSSVEIYNVRTGRAREVWQTDRLVEAPNFAPDGSYLLLNGDGLLFRIPLDGGEVVQVDTGFAVNCNNDHGISPDGTEIVISDKTEFGKSSIYILPIEGGTPRLFVGNLNVLGQRVFFTPGQTGMQGGLDVSFDLYGYLPPSASPAPQRTATRAQPEVDDAL